MFDFWDTLIEGVIMMFFVIVIVTLLFAPFLFALFLRETWIVAFYFITVPLLYVTVVFLDDYF